MPELSEVEVSRRALWRWWEGQRATAVVLADVTLMPPDEFTGLEHAMTTAAPASIKRRGKVLLVDFATQGTMMVHYRMTGKIAREPERPGEKFRLAWQLQDGSWLVFRDPRRFGQVEWAGPQEVLTTRWPLLGRLGPEPHDIATGAQLAARVGLGSARSLKGALLDQSVVAGVGNIAISELYWRLGLHPSVKANELDQAQWDALAREMPAYFDWLVEVQEAEDLGYLHEGAHVPNPFSVYAKRGKPCPRCQGSIEQERVAGRSTYFCPSCQPAPLTSRAV